MDRKPPQRAPVGVGVNVAANVPIVGQRLHKTICRQGHYDESSVPFQMVVPIDGGEAIGMVLCRKCWVDFVNEHFGVRAVTDEEADEIKAKIKTYLEQAETERQVVSKSRAS